MFTLFSEMMVRFLGSIINIQDDILKIHALGLLDDLLINRTTKRNILWATDAHSDQIGRAHV